MENLIAKLKSLIKKRNEEFILSGNTEFYENVQERECYIRKQKCNGERGAEIVKSIVDGQIVGRQTHRSESKFHYALHIQYLIRQGEKFFLEEEIQQRMAIFQDGKLVQDIERLNFSNGDVSIVPLEREIEPEVLERWSYDRREAVRYAERWWNDYNPQYRRFENNCTNFVSQCLRAGGAPMSGYPNRSKGWWYQNNNWSYSWSVAHSMRWHLSGAKSGLRGQEMESAQDLSLGDVICYDFNGGGNWQHTTIVVAKDSNGMPLVNAQTTNSRMRYWAYEDSTAWTPNIKYKFFHIIDG